MNDLPSAQPLIVGGWVLGFLFVVGVCVAVWKIDEHFVTRREFNQAIEDLKSSLGKIHTRLGIPSE